MNKQDLIRYLELQRHPEGGYFAETYRSPRMIATDRFEEQRSLITSIYFLLTDDQPIDHFHVNKSNILHYFHGGSPITYLLLSPNGSLEKFTLGMDFAKGERPQLLVPGGYWKAAVLEKGEFGLLGEAVAPGFAYEDMQLAQKHDFQQRFPHLWHQLAPYVKD